MKVIISHDVDHLYPSDHFFSDLIIPKIWVRSFLELIKTQINFKTFFWRLLFVFDKRMNRIPELCEYDKLKGVKATYFFGMANALGMSYKKEKALPWIKYVRKEGYDAGVHGCDYQDLEKIKEEHDSFNKLTGISDFGIRNHYVRYDNDTFNKMSQVGYLFDTSEFNKEKLAYKTPYQVGKMWEFPLSIMDGYVLHHDLEDAKKRVVEFCNGLQDKKDTYLTFLFHDSYFNKKCYPLEYCFYKWFVDYAIEKGWIFISYRDAIKELEQ